MTSTPAHPAPPSQIIADPRDVPDHPTAEILSSERVYSNFVKVDTYTVRVQNFDASWTPPYTRDILSAGASGTAAAILPYDPVNDTVILIEQFRLPALVRQRKSAWTLESVAGMIEIGDSANNTAIRETLEESGHDVQALEKVGEFLSSPGAFTEVMHCYIARITAGPSGTMHGLSEEHENIKVHVLPLSEAIALADRGVIEDMKTSFLLNWLARHHKELRQRWMGAGA